MQKLFNLELLNLTGWSIRTSRYRPQPHSVPRTNFHTHSLCFSTNWPSSAQSSDLWQPNNDLHRSASTPISIQGQG